MNPSKSIGCILLLIAVLAGQNAVACMFPGPLKKEVSYSHSIFVANILEFAIVSKNETSNFSHAEIEIDIVRVLHGEVLEGRQKIYLAKNQFNPLSVYLGIGEHIFAVTSTESAGVAYLGESIGSDIVVQGALWVVGSPCSDPYILRSSERSLSFFDRKLHSDLKRRFSVVDE